jgi:hypothetical protein
VATDSLLTAARRKCVIVAAFALPHLHIEAAARHAGNDRWNILGSPKNIKWSATFPIPLVGPGDAGYSACAAAANTPALQESLGEEEGCYVQNGTVLFPNAIGTFGNMGRNIFHGPDFVD